MSKKKSDRQEGKICRYCDKPSTDLRRLNFRNNKKPGIHEFGPYDRTCAYVIKNGKIPPISTIPKTKLNLNQC